MTIKAFADLIAVLTLQKQNLSTYLTQVNATAGDVTEVTNELGNLTAIATFAELADGYKKAVFEIKQTLYDAELATPIPAFPPALTPPTLTGALAGALTRTRDRNRRFKAAAGYTDVIGDLLGIGPTSGDAPIDPFLQPHIDVFPAQMGYLFSVVVTNRFESDQWEVLVQPVGSSTWKSNGFATGKSSDFTYNPGSAASDAPVQLRVMVQLKKNNENYGDPSDIVMATVNP
jgi:hypothetical protein